ncbi:unnamed protein product [Scytosiphon promiscuus]
MVVRAGKAQRNAGMTGPVALLLITTTGALLDMGGAVLSVTDEGSMARFSRFRRDCSSFFAFGVEVRRKDCTLNTCTCTIGSVVLSWRTVSFRGSGSYAATLFRARSVLSHSGNPLHSLS